MTSTHFRALREMSGMTQNTLAELMHVDVRSVRRWEKGVNPLPQEALDIIADALKGQEKSVEEAIEEITDYANRCDIIKLPYWTAATWSAVHPEERKCAWHEANANIRIVARKLMSAGYQVEFVNIENEQNGPLDWLI